MDFSYFDKAEEKLDTFVDYLKTIKEKNRELNRTVYSLERDMKQKGPSDEELDALKKKHSHLIDERDSLIMEQELVRKKVEALIGKVDMAIASEPKDA